MRKKISRLISLVIILLVIISCENGPLNQKGTVVLNPENGTSTIVLSGDVGAIAILPVPTRKGFSFVGWYDDLDNVYHDSINFRDESINLFARWKTCVQICGSISIPEESGYLVSDFWVKSSNGIIDHISSDGTFSLSGFEIGKSYDLYFSCSEPSVATAKTISYEPAVQYGALAKGIVIESEDMVDLGVFPMRPTGTIIGTAILDDSENGDNSDIDVVISGTWLTTKTNSDGSYIIHDIPEGQYSIIFRKFGYNDNTIDNVILSAKDVSTSPILSLEALSLAKKANGIMGVVTLEGITDYSGVSVSIPGTSYKTVTNENGEFTIMAEPGSYSGLLYKIDDYTLATYGSKLNVEDDSQCLIPVMNMKAVNAKAVFGKVVLKGVSDYSGVVIKLKGSGREFSTLSDSEGNWKLEHIPLGKYELSFVKDNVPSYTFGLTVLPGHNEVSTYTLVPNGASVLGIIMNDHPINNAEVILKNKATEEQISCLSSEDGSFCFLEVEPENDYSLIIQCTGWDAITIPVENLMNMESRDLGCITLNDSITPTINSFSIDAGADTSYDNKLYFSISVSEEGSGLKKVEVAESSDFTKNYASFDDAFFYYDYAYFYYHCSKEEGTKTLYVKATDNAGNTSETVTSTIDLVILPTYYSGTLSGDQLHWTVEDSPIYVTENVYVSEGNTLIIDAGVDVIIQNNSSINITGSIQVNGTESNHVTISGGGFYISSNMNVTTKDDSFKQTSGSSMSYTDIAVPFIVGDIGFHHCSVNTSFHGDSKASHHYDVLFEHCSVIGGIGRCFNLYSVDSSFKLSSFSVWNPLVIDSQFEYTTSAQLNNLGFVGSGGYDSVAGNSGNVWIANGGDDFTGFYNSYFKNWPTMECPETCINNTFENCNRITFDLYNWFSAGTLRGALTLTGNSFEGTSTITINALSCYDNSKIALNVAHNNFGNCQFVYSGYKGQNQYDISQNYFGDINTQIIYTNEGGKNLEFITDYFDNINLPELIYYPSLHAPVDNCGCSISIMP